MKRLCLAPLLILSLLTPVAAQTARKPAPLNDADVLLIDGAYGKAADAYRSFAQFEGFVGLNAKLRLAAALLKRDESARALAAAEAAVAASPNGDAYALRSLARFRAGRFALAEADRDAALAAKDGDSALAHLANARLLASRNRSSDVLAAADRALQGTSVLDRVFRADALLERASALDDLNRTGEAIAALEAALAITPKTNELLVNNMSAQLAFRRQYADREFMKVAAGGPTSTIDFTLLSGLPVVNISVNGAPPAPFVVDTGAGVSVLFPSYAKKIGFVPREERAFAGAVGGDGKVGLRYGLADSAKLGDFAVLNVPFAVLDWELGSIAGIVGLPLLRPFVTTFDYPRRNLRLSLNSARDGAASKAATSFRLVGNAIYLEAMVNGQGPFNFGLDTGASTPGVPVDELVATTVKLNPNAPGARKTRGAGAAGGQDAVTYPNMRVSWAGLPDARTDLISQRITPARAERRDGESGLVADTEVEGLIGFALLHSAVITIDFTTLTITVA